jgi:transcriptional regulator with XRE-family HTH domain
MRQEIIHQNLIKDVLKEKGITQTWLAKQLGLSFCMANAYVCYRKQPNLINIFKVAEFLMFPQKI